MELNWNDHSFLCAHFCTEFFSEDGVPCDNPDGEHSADNYDADDDDDVMTKAPLAGGRPTVCTSC